VTAGRQLRFWLIGLLLATLTIWILSGMLLPFVVGLAIAYGFSPLVDRMERRRLPRWLGTTLVLASFVLALVVFVLLLLPLAEAQVSQLIDSLPQYREALRGRVMPLIERLVSHLSDEDVQRLRGAAGQYAFNVAGWAAQVLRGVLTGGLALIDVASLLFITPVVAFYLLRDWSRLVATVDRWLPRDHAPTIRQQAREINRTLSGFVRGQALVCVALGTFYAVGLSAAGLNFGLVIGLLAGVLTFVPYVGTLFGFASSVSLALLQFDDVWRVGVIVGVFLVGQALEGNVLTPKLVGDKVGLHPVWVMFALLAGASLFGFLGVLIAVPMAATIGVLVRFALGQYLQSSYYHGDGIDGR
jgi:predicted PurR-regulated permease PerM